MTKFEEQMLKAQEEDKIIFYDYLQYKKAAGWFTGSDIDFSDFDWHRPEVIKKAMYDANFLLNLSDYYFMGFPIKELLKTSNLINKCNVCAVALSLYFDDFQIVTCNLKNYVDYYNKKTNNKIEEYKHTFIMVGLNEIKSIIDPTFGFITDMNTYNSIFAIDNVSIIFSEEIQNIEVYKYIKDRKDKKQPIFQTEDEYQNYKEEILKYESLCRTYTNRWNRDLQKFIREYLLNEPNFSSIYKWVAIYGFKSLNLSINNSKIQYPTKNMFSIEDDEFDLTLDNVSWNKETIKRNNEVLENYHKEPEEVQKNKIKNLFNKLFN